MSEETEGLSSERLTFICPPGLLDAIGRRATANYVNKSEYVRSAVVDRLRREGALPQLPSPHGPEARV